MLGIEGAGEVVLTRRVLENTTSEGTLRCELAAKDDLVLEDNKGGCAEGKGRKLKFCGIVSLSFSYLPLCDLSSRVLFHQLKLTSFAPLFL